MSLYEIVHIENVLLLVTIKSKTFLVVSHLSGRDLGHAASWSKSRKQRYEVKRRHTRHGQYPESGAYFINLRLIRFQSYNMELIRHGAI